MDEEDIALNGIGFTTLLFVPGTSPERVEKALASGAGLVCIDLEDSVPADSKRVARAAAVGASINSALALRINPVTMADGIRDLAALADAERRFAFVLLPKAESPADIAVVRGAVGEGVGIIPLVETPAGLARTAEIAAAPGVAAMMFGGGDMAAELGVELAWEPLLVARSLFLLGCAQAGAPAIDVPYLDLDDSDGLAEETRKAQILGFAAKAAIHPAQIATIDGVLRPSAEQVAAARAAEAAFAAAGGAAVRFHGRMLEAPAMRRYRRILAQTDKERNEDA